MSEPQLATITEIKNNWDIDTLFDAHEALDIIELMKKTEIEKMERETAKWQKKR